MSSKYTKSKWFLIRNELLGKNPEENYIHYYQDQDGEYASLCLDGGNYTDIGMNTFKALMKRNLLRQIAHHSTIQPDTESFRYAIK